MKNLKKILIALAVVALLVSAVVLTVTAEEYTGDLETLQKRFDGVLPDASLDDQSQKLALTYQYLKEKPIDPATEGYAELIAQIDAKSVEIGVKGRAEAAAQSTFENKIKGIDKIYAHFEICPAPATTEGYAELIAGLETDYVQVIVDWINDTAAKEDGYAKRELLVKIYNNIAAKPIDKVANAEALSTARDAAISCLKSLYTEYENITDAVAYSTTVKWNAVGQMEYFVKNITDIAMHSDYSALNAQILEARAAVNAEMSAKQAYLDGLSDFDTYDWTDGMALYTFDDTKKLSFINSTGSCYAEIRTDENGNKYQTLIYGNPGSHLYTEPSHNDNSRGWIADFDIMVSSNFRVHGYTSRQASVDMTSLFEINCVNRDGNIVIQNSTAGKEKITGTMLPNVWNHFTFTYDPAINGGSVYLNYEKLFDYQHKDTHVFNGFRMGTNTTDQEVYYDNVFFFAGTQYRDVNKFSKMTEAEKFVYYVNFFSDPANAERALSCNKAYVKARTLYSTYINNNNTLPGADRLYDDNGNLVDLSVYAETFANCNYEEEIKKPAQATNLATLKGLVAELTIMNVDSETLEDVKATIAEIDLFVNDNKDLLNKADQEYLLQMKAIAKVKADIQQIESVKVFVDALARFSRATSYYSMNKHYESAKAVYEKAEFYIPENEAFVKDDPYVRSFEQTFNGFKYDPAGEEPYPSPEEIVTAFEYYATLEETVAERKAYEASEQIVECYEFITGLEGYELTPEFLNANFDYINTYISVARTLINSGAYDVEYEGINEIVEGLLEIDCFFYEELQKIHIEVLKTQLANYLATDSYITKVGICEYLTQYVNDKDNDVAVYNENLSERVLLAVAEEIEEINELLVVLDVYKRELLLQEEDYAAVLEENTALFIGAVTRMQTYLTYSEIKPIFDEARGYYYGMNVDSEDAAAAIEIYNSYADMLNAIEVSSEMFKGHVAKFAQLEGEDAKDMGKIYEILSDCMTYAYEADLGIEGVEEAAQIYAQYLAEYLAFANAVNSGVANATMFVISARANMIAPTVLAVIGGIINS